jgi:hypothetical protein
MKTEVGPMDKCASLLCETSSPSRGIPTSALISNSDKGPCISELVIQNRSDAETGPVAGERRSIRQEKWSSEPLLPDAAAVGGRAALQCPTASEIEKRTG